MFCIQIAVSPEIGSRGSAEEANRVAGRPIVSARIFLDDRRRIEARRIAPAQGALEALGALPARAATGHRARGLQPRRHRLDYFRHDHACSRAYRWGENGIGGISDRHQFLCFALALWNGRDPILKECLFGLSGPEGNHGEDAKEYYFYLDSTPTHSYLKFLNKYPQAEFPYAREVAAELSCHLTRIFLRGKDGRRPVFGGIEKFQTDLSWGDLIPFHEYFHGDTGAGLGASHQTGWTGVVAKLIEQSGRRL